MTFEIKRVEYIGSFPDYLKAQIPPYPQIAIAGRSNVGKSTLINKITNRKSIAKVSSTPGKTRLLNFFEINNKYLIVDLPGYGYAKVSKKERDTWKPMVEGFLTNSDKLRGLVLLIDGRRGFQKEEEDLLDFCNHIELKTAIVFTKCDKLNQSQKTKLKNSNQGCIFFSSITGIGKLELLKKVYRMFN
ncbi:MAG: YihA family ribosome biogenesis GTP-binding protein [candidate division Zixibacteria bacterium]|nr:YihA family ribosome biogenesis GTP-binding protein [candidate division Zixibacteria bacterium]